VEISTREFWALIHGFVLGGLFLVAFTGGLAEIWTERAAWETPSGLREKARRLSVGMTTMAVVAWLTVITGTWIVYPWYREEDPESARSQLLADPDTADWHEFAMEWKEHIAWIAPMLATVAAFIVLYYRSDLARNAVARRLAIGLFIAAFAIAAIAGALGALITKNASV
jgi:hypothetical protein